MQSTHKQTCCRTHTTNQYTQMCTYTYKHINIYTVYTYVSSLNKNRRAAVRTLPTSTHTNVYV